MPDWIRREQELYAQDSKWRNKNLPGNVNFDSILTPVLRSVQEIQLGTSGLWWWRPSSIQNRKYRNKYIRNKREGCHAWDCSSEISRRCDNKHLQDAYSLGLLYTRVDPSNCCWFAKEVKASWIQGDMRPRSLKDLRLQPNWHHRRWKGTRWACFPKFQEIDLIWSYMILSSLWGNKDVSRNQCGNWNESNGHQGTNQD